jgi:YggT family protein
LKHPRTTSTLVRMTDALVALAQISGMLRTALLAGGILLAAVAALDWAVRTRRINPFSGIARFMRSTVDPRLAGIERRVTRAGGHQSTTPWWAVLAYVVIAALLLAAIDFVFSFVTNALRLGSAGPFGVLVLVVTWTFGFLRIALFLRVILSWFPSVARSRWLSWSYGATEWMLRPIRRHIPAFGMIDLSPILAYFALELAEWLVLTLMGVR